MFKYEINAIAVKHLWLLSLMEAVAKIEFIEDSLVLFLSNVQAVS